MTMAIPKQRKIATQGQSWPYALTPFDGSLYFIADTHTNRDEDLAVIDADAEDGYRVIVENMGTGTAQTRTSKLTNTDDALYFTNHTPANGRELYRAAGSCGALMQTEHRPFTQRHAPPLMSRSPVLFATVVLIACYTAGCDCSSPTVESPDSKDEPIEQEARALSEMPPNSDPYILQTLTILDGTGDEPAEQASVVVRDGRFGAIGPTDELDVADDLEVIDLSGQVIVPGLIDSHVHAGQFQMRLDSFLQQGVTSIKSLGDRFPSFPDIVEEITDDETSIPRVFIAGPIFTAPGGHPEATLFAEQPLLKEEAVVAVDDPDEARKAVREVIDGGVDLIKLVYDDIWGEYERLDREVMEAIVDEAVAHEVIVTAHVGSDSEAQEVLDAGVNGIEHLIELSDETIEQMVNNGCFWVPTLAVLDAQGDSIPDSYLDSVHRAATAGVDIVAGSDVGNPGLSPGYSLHRELRLLVEAGLTPNQAITAATYNAGRFLGEDIKVGRVVEGAHADFLILDGDPRSDIDLLSRPRWIARDGEARRY